MKNVLFPVLLIVGISFSGNVYISGQKLVQYWHSYNLIEGTKTKGANATGDDAIKRALYMGYVLGVADACNGNSIFIPQEVLSDQLYHIVGKWIEQRPEKWNYGGEALIKSALSDAFPDTK